MRFVLWALWMAVVANLGLWVGRTSPMASTDGAPTAGSASLLGRRSSTMRFQQHACLQASIASLPEHLLAAEERGGGFESLLVLAHWFQVDREGLLVWLELQGNRESTYAVLAQWQVQQGIEAAWAEAGTDTLWERALDDALVKVDPERAFANLDSSRNYRIRESMMGWAKRDFGGAVEATRNAKRWQKNDAVEGLAEAQFSRLSFEQAFIWAQGFDVLPEIAMGTVIDQLAKTDLESALRHLSESGISKARHMNHTKLALGRLPLAEAIDLLAQYSVRVDLFGSLAELPSDPIEAAQLLAPVARQVERVSLYNWSPVTDDIAGSLRYLASDPDNAAHRALLEGSLGYWNHHHQEEVTAFIREIPDPVRQATYAQEYSGGSLDLMNSIDFEVLGDDFSESRVIGRFRDRFLSMTHMNPLRAIAEAEALQRPSWRAVAREWILRIWSEHEEVAAIDWAESLAPEDRQAAEFEALMKVVRDRMP
ncbi:MAG: hypothetical protein ACI8T1_001306 [Verrucomicrobiales bacterium]|jgi:hypothetical protein